MSLDTMAFILGGILIGAAIFGGGLEIKELKLPQIGTVPRVLAFAVGTVFIAMALLTNPKSKEFMPSVGGASQPARETFKEPVLGDLRVDACYEFAKLCGEPAATAWCKGKGMSKAVEFPLDNVGARGIATRVIGTNAECRAPYCTSFSYIVCEK